MKYKKGTFVVIPNMDKLEGQPTEVQTIFLWICNFANDEGQCFPSRKTLAKKCGMAVKTLDKYLAQLIELGLVDKKTRKIGKKEYTSNLYQVLVSDTLPCISQGTTPTPQNDPITIPNINHTNLIGKSVDKTTDKKEKKKSKKQLRLETPYSFKRELELLGEDNWVVKKIIYNYWKIKGYEFENYTQFDKALARELRPATALSGYNSTQINLAMKYCQDNYTVWTLETVYKRIIDLVNKK